MVRFIFVTFAFLGWAFYELSGGSDFDPTIATLTNVKTDPLKPSAHAEVTSKQTNDVTRVSLNLTTVEDVLSGKQGAKAKPDPAIKQVAFRPAENTQESVVLPSLVTNAALLTQPQAAAAESFTDIRRVTGNRVNVRGGPGTNYGVVDKLIRGDEVEILEDRGNGWVRTRPVGGGPVGWMADFLLNEG